MRNTYSMCRCERFVGNERDICEVHKRRRLLYLPNGSMWENTNKSNFLQDCKKYRNSILFWNVLYNGCVFNKLNIKYRPKKISDLRIERKSYLIKELYRLDVKLDLIKEIGYDRHYWFLNLLYYLGNFNNSVKKIQRFYKNIIKKRIAKKKNSIKIIWKYYLRYKLFKKLPKLVKNGKFLKENKCINIQDPITQQNFCDVNLDRWVICKVGNNNEKSWWFDISSAIQLLGYPGSHSGENPFNRKEYPFEFLFDIEEKLNKIKNKYDDIYYLTLQNYELKSLDIDENLLPSPCYNYNRFQIHIKANKLFHSFEEFGYNFPRNIFIKYNLGELRLLALKLYKRIRNLNDRLRFYPKFHQTFTPSFVISLPSFQNTTLLKNIILDILLDFVTYQTNYDDRITACLKTLYILGEINEESHFILHFYNLCDCNYLSQSMIRRFSVANQSIRTDSNQNNSNQNNVNQNNSNQNNVNQNNSNQNNSNQNNSNQNNSNQNNNDITITGISNSDLLEEDVE